MPRRLLLLLAAFTALATISLAGIATAASTGAGAQTRVRAFTPAAPTLIRLQAAQTPCSRPVSLAPTAQIASGFCVAAEDEGGIAEQIANGHAFGKHVGEFPGVSTPGELQQVIEGVMDNPESLTRDLSGGRTAYYDEASNTLVITNPSAADGGTVFKPTGGLGYFNGLR